MKLAGFASTSRHRKLESWMLPAAAGSRMLARFLIPILLFSRKPLSMSELACSRHLSFRCPEVKGRLVRLGLRVSDGPDPGWAFATCL
jgi:hypothetical protein